MMVYSIWSAAVELFHMDREREKICACGLKVEIGGSNNNIYRHRILRRDGDDDYCSSVYSCESTMLKHKINQQT
jgi:hypothetical protein